MSSTSHPEGRLTAEEWEWVSRSLSVSLPDPPPDAFEGSPRTRKITIDDWRRRAKNVQRLRHRIMLRVDEILAASDAVEERRHFNRLRRLVGEPCDG